MKRILVVDDSAVSRKLAIFVLQNLGCDADSAGSADEAIEALKQNRYDAIFMDIHMPETNGCETAAMIRNSEAGSINANTPIIAITGSDLPEERELCKSAGMSDFLAKPFSAESAGEILKKHCN